MPKKPSLNDLVKGASGGRKFLKGSADEPKEYVHLHLYLPRDLVERLRLFQAQNHERWPRLSRLVAEALERFLEGEG